MPRAAAQSTSVEGGANTVVHRTTEGTGQVQEQAGNTRSGTPGNRTGAGTTRVWSGTPGSGQVEQRLYGPILPGSGKVDEQPAPGGEEQKNETIVDMVHAGISKTIQGTATWVDSFFGNRRYESELNESYGRISYFVFLERNAPMLKQSDVQLRWVLPQLREKTHLVLSGTPKETQAFSAIDRANR